jgi:hypothetical protein
MFLQQTHQTKFPIEAVHRFAETATRSNSLFWSPDGKPLHTFPGIALPISSRYPKTRMKAEIGTMDSRKMPGAAI